MAKKSQNRNLKNSSVRRSKAAPPAERDDVRQYAEAVISGKILAGKPVRLACQRHLKDIERQCELDIKFDSGLAQRAIAFFEEMLQIEIANKVKPFILEPWQRFIVGSLFGWLNEDGSRRFRTAYIEAAKGSGKALSLDTPIPTPNGWIAMREIRVGDVVFDDQGKPTTVLEVHSIMEGHDCFAVTFDDGEQIIADAEHLWITEKRTEGCASNRGRAMRGVPRASWANWRRKIRSTSEIAQTLRYKNGCYFSANHSIALAGALQTPPADLPITPYILGLWLGNGDSDCARLTIGAIDEHSICALVNAEGEPLRRQRSIGNRAPRWAFSDGVRGGSKIARVGSMQARLRMLGLLGNKHIPRNYLRASIEQRLALLQGLCDTDGSAAGKGVVEWVTVTPQLAEGFHELLSSLGIKAAMPRPCPRRVNGRPAQDAYRFNFSPREEMHVFRLNRKQRQMTVLTKRRRLSQDRRIVACELVPSVPVRCIGVASDSQLFLAGRGMIPTHNTPMAAGIGLYGLIADGVQSPEIYSAATTSDQAKICFKDAAAMVRRSEELAKAVEENVASLFFPLKLGIFRPVSSEHRGLDGKRVHIALVDELHEHPTALVVDKMRAGTKARRNALIFEITNAGSDLESVCYNHHEYSLKILEGIMDDPSWFAYVCSLDEGDDWLDEKVWPKANPGLGTILPIQYLREQVREAQGMPTKQNIVKRLNFCIWTQQHTIWIPSEQWAACNESINRESLLDQPCWAGLDLSSKLDLTALVLAFRKEADTAIEISLPAGQAVNGKPQRKTLNLNFSVDILPFFYIPEETMYEREKVDRVPYSLWVQQGFVQATPGNIIDFDFIYNQFIDEIAPKYSVQEIGFDPYNAASFSLNLQDAGYKVVEVRQGVQTMSEPSKIFHALIKSKRVRNGGHPVLRWNISNVAAKEDKKENIFPYKQHERKRIDGVIAAIIALSRMIASPARDDGINYSGLRSVHA